MNKTLGMILVGLGLIGLAWGGFTYTTKEKIVDLGPIEATRDVKHDIPLLPIGAGLVLVGGVVLLVAAKRA